MLTKRFKIPAGLKAHSVKMPKEILDSPRMIKFMLRGMFNTDGGVGFDRRKTYKKPYVRINYVSVSKNLIEQMHNLLDKYEIPHSIHRRNDPKAMQIQINGEENTKLFLKKIGFSNQRHLKKVNYLIRDQ